MSRGDTVEKSELERALAGAREELALVQQVAGLGTWEIDVSTGKARWSARTFELLGCAPSAGPRDIAGFLELVDGSDRERVASELDVLLRQRQPGSLRLRICRPDGERRHLLAHGVTLANEQGEPQRLFGTIQDVTDREILVDRQRQSEERLTEQAALLDAATDAILVRRLDDRVVYWNAGATRIFGFRPDEALGRSATELLAGEPNAHAAARRQLLEHGEWSGELLQRRSDGREILTEAHWTLVRNVGGEPQSVLSISTDITDRRRLEQQYLRAQRLESVGTLAGGIAHDLNNVLAPILMAVTLIRARTADPAVLRLLDPLEESANRGASIVRQVLSFARGAEGEIVDVDAADLVADLGRIMRETFPRSIEVVTRASPHLPLLAADATQLHQLLLNLCVNARDAMPHGGQLTLEADHLVIDASYAGMQPGARPGPHVVLRVADTGSGISAEHRERIFDPFFTTKPPGQGTGLGLATVAAIAKGHGGFVEVHSEVGRGTRFEVFLPTASSGREPSSESAQLWRGHGELILLVDDEPAVLQLTTQTLETFGYRVITATNGAEAVARYAERRDEVAAVVTDLAMPVMDGIATIRALRTLAPGVRIVAASGLATGLGARAQDLAVAAVLNKPYSAELLLRTLRDILRADAAACPDPSTTTVT